MLLQKTGMCKRQFRIGDLAKELKVKKFVIRFWEKEFGIKSDRSDGGQRFYTSDDLKTFALIKDLLYNKGFTIAGAKKQLSLNYNQDKQSDHQKETQQPKKETGHAFEKTKESKMDKEFAAATRPTCPKCESLQAELKLIKEQLFTLKTLLLPSEKSCAQDNKEKNLV